MNLYHCTSSLLFNTQVNTAPLRIPSHIVTLIMWLNNNCSGNYLIQDVIFYLLTYVAIIEYIILLILVHSHVRSYVHIGSNLATY